MCEIKTTLNVTSDSVHSLEAPGQTCENIMKAYIAYFTHLHNMRSKIFFLTSRHKILYIAKVCLTVLANLKTFISDNHFGSCEPMNLILSIAYITNGDDSLTNEIHNRVFLIDSICVWWSPQQNRTKYFLNRPQGGTTNILPPFM